MYISVQYSKAQNTNSVFFFVNFRLPRSFGHSGEQRQLHLGLCQQALRSGRLQAVGLVPPDDPEELPRRGGSHQLWRERGREGDHQRVRGEEDQRKDQGSDQERSLDRTHQVLNLDKC